MQVAGAESEAPLGDERQHGCSPSLRADEEVDSRPALSRGFKRYLFGQLFRRCHPSNRSRKRFGFSSPPKDLDRSGGPLGPSSLGTSFLDRLE